MTVKATTATKDARRYDHLPGEDRADLADAWDHLIYFCPECDDEDRAWGHCEKCPRYPKEHDESGYMGTGTDYPKSIRRLASKIADDT
jgi:hypothetical protein